MANLIGQYIHYNYLNYVKYGLQRKDYKSERKGYYKPSQNNSKVFLNQKKIIKNELKELKYSYNPAQIKQLENRLNLFYSWGRSSNPDENKKQQEIIDFILDKFGKRLKGKSFDFNSMSIESFYAYLQKLNLDSVQKLTKLNTDTKFYNRGDAIDARMKEILKARTIIAENIKNRDSSLERLLQEIGDLERDWNVMLAKFDGSNLSKMRIKDSDRKDFTTKINEVIFQLKFNDPQLKGEITEAILFIVDYLESGATEKGLSEIYNEFKKLKKSERSQKGVFNTFFDSKVVSSMEKLTGSTKHKFDKNFGLFTAHATEDKVDLNIHLKDFTVPVSIKNYNLSTPDKDIHLLNGRSLLGLVQEYTNFVNHYLNVVPYRSGMHIEGAPTPQLWQLAQDTMKLTILLKALRGGVYSLKGNTIKKSNMADFLVINDSSAQNPNYKVYHLSDILWKVENNMDLLTIGKDFENGLNNAWQNKNSGDRTAASNQRIAKLLMQMHEMNLKVSIKKGALK